MADESGEELVEIPLERMLPKPNIPAGLSPWVVFGVAHSLRNAGDGGWGPGKTQPIAVRRHPDVDDYFVILEGRHRWMAHWLAGKSTATCIVEN